jgi:hypothetical protein
MVFGVESGAMRLDVAVRSLTRTEVDLLMEAVRQC